MPKHKLGIPLTATFYVSYADFYENAREHPQRVTFYSRHSGTGQWYANNEVLADHEVPDDLWDVRMVQR